MLYHVKYNIRNTKNTLSLRCLNTLRITDEASMSYQLSNAIYCYIKKKHIKKTRIGNILKYILV